MKVIKSMLIGGMIATGVYLLSNDAMSKDRKKIMKKGRKVMKKIGVV